MENAVRMTRLKRRWTSVSEMSPSSVAMKGIVRERLEDQDVERAANKLRRDFVHDCLRV
jgi:hypothetical protein